MMRRHQRGSSEKPRSSVAGATWGGVNADEQVEQALQILTPREAQILRVRFGLGPRHRWGAGPLEPRLDMGRLWFRHLQARALRKLRASALSA